ncbi:acyltransferase family protein [Cellulomonas sp. APG4]|uniref:acyltransferase family protein n=1 Tax=Cellulomonas sp. APG4 TaxID=1538656 RepID=UPI00351BB1CD
MTSAVTASTGGDLRTRRALREGSAASGLAPAAADRFRPEIQGLRTVAVGLVVLYHLWPNRLTGGFVGVDVFFVISGFLITAHIHRELVSTGTIGLRRFWARRVRRLLPASLLVLVASSVAALVWVPATMWDQTARQVVASALYVQNWALAGDAVDYMAADNVPTVAQHYWSLSVEEQFYLVWPVLLLGFAALWRAAPRRVSLSSVLVGGLGLLALVSLGYSVWVTSQDQSFAYFVTPARAWEFAAGAMLALVAAKGLPGQVWRAPLAWAGLAAVLAAGLAFDGATPFPGWVALLPVLGTVAVLAAGTTASRFAPARWLSLAPMRFGGDISYSVYLWHWPLIVVWPHATGAPLGTVDKLAILVLTVLLAWASKVLVEDPARTWGVLAAAPWRTFAAGALGMVVAVGAGTGLTWELDRRAAAAEAATQQAAGQGCVGPTALDPANGCDPVEGTGALVPPPEVVSRQNTEPLYRGCQASLRGSEVASCVLGPDPADSHRTVAMVGDSHATQWFPAMEAVGEDLGWTVRTYTKASCPFTLATRVLASEQTDAEAADCGVWRDAVLAELLASDVDVVVTAAYTTAYEWAPSAAHDLADPRVDGFTALWAELVEAGIEVVVLSDVPRTQGENVPNCLAAHPDDRMACAVPRETGLTGSAVVDAVGQSGARESVHLIQLDDAFCDDTTCYPVVGDMVVYRDYSHIAADYATALAPRLATELEELVGR